jgi:16S rRNA (adenine1518-N6/adenine1519-N6)-dimethyltransferase
MGKILKKRYGQHFLKDTGILSRICRLIQPAAEDVMIEIGAGAGALSVLLAPEVFRLLALEIDLDLIPTLTAALEPFPNAGVLAQDVLKADLAAISLPYLNPGKRLRICGNLPYNIGTAIIERLLAMPLPIEDMVFMLQLETAERISARPGSKEYGFFSVYCRHCCYVKIAFRVSPECFIPRPKVRSAVLTMRLRQGPRDPRLEEDFVAIAKAAFAFRRKKLINSLRRHPVFGPIAAELLEQAGIDGSRRPEKLSVEEYERLARNLPSRRFSSRGERFQK